MSNLFLKPGNGLIVRDPESGALMPAAGQWKTDNEFWRRRLRDGDVIEAKPPAEKSAAKLPSPAPAKPMLAETPAETKRSDQR